MRKVAPKWRNFFLKLPYLDNRLGSSQCSFVGNFCHLATKKKGGGCGDLSKRFFWGGKSHKSPYLDKKKLNSPYLDHRFLNVASRQWGLKKNSTFLSDLQPNLAKPSVDDRRSIHLTKLKNRKPWFQRQNITGLLKFSSFLV